MKVVLLWIRANIKDAGKLIYLAHTRLGIAYALSVVSQFMHDPRVKHLPVANLFR